MPPEHSTRGSKNRRGPLAAILVVAVLAIAVLLVAQAIVRHNAVQRCLDSGRRDCEPALQNP